MARGGYRVGSGRPKSAAFTFGPKAEGIKTIKRAAKAAGLSPKEYMLSVMRDAGATIERRDRMAIAVAPYCHERAEDAVLGK